MINRFLDQVDGPRRLIDALAKQQLLRNSTPLIDELVVVGKVLSYQENEILIHEGDSDSDIFFLITGEVIVEFLGEELARRYANNHVGEMALIDTSAIRSATVTAISETIVLRVSETSFTLLAVKYSFLWRGLALELATRLRGRNKLVVPLKTIVILIHGIRTRAEWQEKVAPILEDSNTTVIPIRYGYLDIFRFWCPIWTRLASISEIEWKVSRAIFENKNAEVVVIAHSYGTYAISNIIKNNPLINISRMILCGGIVRRNFKWGEIRNLPKILNDCGSRDVLPMLASSLTWGFGESGRCGFGTPEVSDRFSDHNHSGFFEKNFVKEHWKPFVDSGKITQTNHERTNIPWMVSILTVVRFRIVILVVILSLIPCVMYFLF
jgi:hypothetical protein